MKDLFGLRASAARRLRDMLICSALAVMFVFSACGGGKTSPPPPPIADFSLGVSPAAVSMTAGGPSATVAVAVTAVNGFAASVSVQVTGLPTGVSVQPTTITVSPGAPQQVTVIAGTNAQSGSSTLTFTGTSSSLSHSAHVSLSVSGTTTLPSRTRYVRTDAFTEYSLWLNSHWIVFNPLTSRFFVSDPEGHRIHVLDAASQTKVATLDVPGAFGIDDSSDHRTLWVGTLIGDVYAIDPVTMTVKKRYLASQIGPYGFAAFTALGLADGRVALPGSQGGIPSVDGSGAFAVWNPADNSITIYASGYGSGYIGPGIPALRVCGGWMGNFGAFTRSPDRTRIYIKSIDSDGTLCAVDPSTGHDTYVTSTGFNNIAISPDSSGTGYVFGYGFGPTGWNPPLPADLQVSVGGKPAAVSAFDNSAFGTISPPFPMMSAGFAIPPGTPGAADVTVTTNSGTTLQRAAFTYFPPVERFPLPAASLAQGIYDPYRDRYYFSDAQQLQVFSRTQGGWQAPILIPGARQLWGLALSPDGSKLAVSDRGANAIHLLDPAHPTAVRTFPLLTETGVDMGPAGLAVSDQGMVYYGAYTYGVSGATGFFRLDTNTGAIKDYGIDNPGLGYSDSYLRAAISADNARVYFNNMGQPFSIDTLTDTVAYATVGPGCCYGDYDLTLSNNQTRLAATGYLYDADLNAGSYLTLSIRERQNIGYLYGMKLSPDGSLLFQPTTTGIDVFDGRVGTLRMRIGLPIHLASTFDSMVADGKDNVLLGIGADNGDGIIVIDLASVPEPAPLPYASSAARRTAFISPWTSLAPVRSSAAKQTSSQTYRAPTPVRVPHVITP